MDPEVAGSIPVTHPIFPFNVRFTKHAPVNDDEPFMFVILMVRSMGASSWRPWTWIVRPHDFRLHPFVLVMFNHIV